ncbi:Putative ribonuclease H protein [Arachis hypogaea]|uniref:Ribonuclease H protein n=1 Tax=Arachis hypogaea TaxID=3818 RepID=A0A6B9V6N4_ARAHY|nr:Putative ribonuclease H protein [Arachis hypogaea]
MWLVIYQRISTKKRLKKFFGGSGCGHHCPDKEESILHVFRDCSKVSRIWTQLIKPEAIEIFFGYHFTYWIEQNLKKELGKEINASWKDLFFTTYWRVWFWKNQEIHNENYQRPINATSEIIIQVQ